MPPTDGYPIARVGIEVASGNGKRADGRVFLDSLAWTGVPDAPLGPSFGGIAWQRAWVPAVDFFRQIGQALRMTQNEGIGLLIQGCREWTDYRVEATLSSQMASSVGLAVRVQGLRRYYCLSLTETRIIQVTRVRDGETTVLASQPFDFQIGSAYSLAFEAAGDSLRGFVAGKLAIAATDPSADQLNNGAIAIVVETGNATATDIGIRPLTANA